MKRPFAGLVALLFCVSLAAAEESKVYEIEPGDDYRSILGQLQPGDEVVFLPGVHEAAVIINVSGEPDRPITFRGVIEDGRRPELRFTRRGHNLWRVRGEHLHIRDLAFHCPNAYGIRVDGGAHITIENCLFRGNGGGDLSANTGDVTSLHVRDSRFVNARRAPVYIGHHDGTIAIRDFRFERNVINGSAIEAGVGYGIQLKLNVDGVIADNYITGTRGPAIMVYGFDDPEPDGRQVVRNNITVGARNNPNIVVGGGPAILEHNLALAGNAGGISVINYGGRNLLHNITLRNNVAAADLAGRDLAIHQSAHPLVVHGNRVFARSEQATLGPLPDTADAADNHAASADDDRLQRHIDELEGFVPSNDTVQAVTESLAADPPRTPGQLQQLLNMLRRE